MTDQTKFAFNANEHSGCYCPMITADRDPASPLGSEITYLYDKEAALISDGDADGSSGLLSDEDAEEAWQRAYDMATDEQRDLMQEVADELGWELQ